MRQPCRPTGRGWGSQRSRYSIQRRGRTPATGTSRFCWRLRSAFSVTLSSATNGSAPPSPANIYADFLNKHHCEGIQHIGIPVEDLAKSVAAYEKLGYHVHQSGAWGDVGKPGSGQYAY